MATSSFYSDNLFRSYPFLAGTSSAVPNNRIAGLKIRLHYGAGFTSFPAAFLEEWKCISGESFLTFSIGSKIKTLTIPANTVPFERIVSDSEDNIEISLIAGHLPQNDEVRSNLHIPVEPVCVIWMQHRGLSRVYIGNKKRNTLPLPGGVESDNYGKVEWWRNGSVIENSPLFFSPGFNCRLSGTGTSIFKAEAVSGGGSGSVSGDLPRGYIERDGEIIREEPPSEQIRNDGLPLNTDVLYSFCNAVGPHIQIIASPSVAVIPHYETHTIIIETGNLGGGAC